MTPAELDSLEAAVKGCVGDDWSTGDDSSCEVYTDKGTLVMDLCDHDYGPEIATGVVAMHNALPALIEMARRCAAYEAGEKGGE